MEEKIVTEETQEQVRKFTYEQLEQIATNLSSQVQQLSVKLQESNMFNIFKRLDYCFKVLEVAQNQKIDLLKEEFVKKCANEIQELMTVPEEPETKE